MTFERTAAGQANRAAFLGVDLVCYVEGDESNEHGLDIAFWDSVFQAIAPGVSIHFAQRGGKPIVESLARSIVASDIQNTIAAMDRDYSEFREGRFIDHKRVFYTYGYSWENDAYCPHIIPRIASRLGRCVDLPREYKAQLAADSDRLRNHIGKVVFADFVALLKGGSVFDREKPGRYSTLNGEGRPEPALDRCRADVQRARRALQGRDMRPSVGYPADSVRFFWGKAYEHYIRLGLQKTIRAFSGNSVQPEHLRDVAIACFCQSLFVGQNAPSLDHYRDAWARFQRPN